MSPLKPASQAPEIPDYESPSISPDRRITIRYYHPTAQKVWCESEWNDWRPLDLQRHETGLWSITSAPLRPEIYKYSLFADGARVVDYQNPAVKNLFSSQVEVPAPEPALYDPQNVPHGSIHLHWYHSSVTATQRRFHVYTPPGYETNPTLAYPVLYLLHGRGDDDSHWLFSGRVNAILDNLIAHGRAVPMIIVMPHGHMRGTNWKTDRAAKIADFSTDFHRCLIPSVEQLYRVQTGPASRAIAGLSMGGGQTLAAGLTHPELFDSFGIFSAGLWPEVTPLLQPILPALRAAPPRLLWIGIGRHDFLYPHCVRLRETLQAAQIPFTYYEDDTAHSWQAWRDYLARFAPLLFRH